MTATEIQQSYNCDILKLLGVHINVFINYYFEQVTYIKPPPLLPPSFVNFPFFLRETEIIFAKFAKFLFLFSYCNRQVIGSRIFF